MKLTLCYTMFNGFEQLIKSINAMRDHVDQIIVCYQLISNTGNRSETAIYEMKQLRDDYPDIIITMFFPVLSVSTKQNERMKHNLMIQTAKKYGATHFILSACDHIYTPEHINHAKNQMIESDYDVCLTKMYTYYKQENWYMWPLENYYMPFIHKMHENTEISNTVRYPVVVDPSVRVNTSSKIIVFEPNECVLHHYSMVRIDIENKFKNAAASIRWKPEQIKTFIHEFYHAKVGDSITYFQNSVICEK